MTDLCTHDDVQFMGAYSLVGGYVCQNCGFNINPVVLHYVRDHPHVMTMQVGPFTDWDVQKEYLASLTEYYFDNYEKSMHQSPHWEREPTKEMLEDEEKSLVLCGQHAWQRDVVADIITFVLGGEGKLRGSRPDEFTGKFPLK